MPTTEVVAQLTPDEFIPGTGPIPKGQKSRQCWYLPSNLHCANVINTSAPPPQSLVHKQRNLSAVPPKKTSTEADAPKIPTRTVRGVPEQASSTDSADSNLSGEFTVPALARQDR